MTNKSQWPSDLQGFSLGKDCWIGIKLNGTWYELDVARGVTFNFPTSDVDITCKRSGFIKEYLPLFNDLQVDTEVLSDANDTCCDALNEASKNRTIFPMGVFTDEGEGPVYYGFVSSLSRNEPIDGVVLLNVSFKLTTFLSWGVESIANSSENESRDPHKILK